MRLQVKPNSFSAASTNPIAPSSFGVTEGQRIKACESATASIMSVSEQVVNGCLGAGAFVHTLCDNGAIKRRFVRTAAHRAGNDDGIGRHLAPEYLAGMAIHDFGGGGEEDSHRKHRTFA